MQTRKRFKQIFGATLLCTAGTMAAHAQSSADGLFIQPQQTVAPTLINIVANRDSTIKDQYIITLRKPALGTLLKIGGIDQLVSSLLSAIGGGKVLHTYDTALFGFSAQLTPAAVKLLKLQPSVLVIEPDRLAELSGVQNNPESWGLDRIDQRDLPLSGSYNYSDKAGEGVHVYIVDSGINPNNPEFTGHIGGGRNFMAGYQAGDWGDCQGHGTHVAGTAAGTLSGVAKKATLHSLRVANCDGRTTSSDMLAGLNWIAKSAPKPGVVNMSIGTVGGRSIALENAARAVVNAGYPMAVSAGNENISACDRSPGADPYIMTVGAVDQYDTRAYFSNYGSCVKIFAPGVKIPSAYNKDSSRYFIMSGTSMASPHVAGAMAIKLGMNTNPNTTALDIERAVLADATVGKVIDPVGSRNNLLYVKP